MALLLANMEHLDAPPGTLIATTAQNGVLGLGKKPELLEAFRDTPGIFRRAAIHHPADPEGFLTGVIRKVG